MNLRVALCSMCADTIDMCQRRGTDMKERFVAIVNLKPVLEPTHQASARLGE